MLRVILFFAVVFGCFYFGIPAFRDLNGKEKLEAVNLVAYSILCSALTVIVMTVFVLAF